MMSSLASVDPSVTVRGNGTVAIADYATVQEGVVIDLGSGGSVTISDRVKIKTGVIIRTHGGCITIGSRTSIGEYSVLAAHGGIQIGALCMIGPYVLLNAAAHITSGSDPYRFQGETTKGIILEDDVWIGARATVLDDVTIGRRAVVGAHSLVKRSVVAGTVVAGCPAVIIRNALS